MPDFFTLSLIGSFVHANLLLVSYKVNYSRGHIRSNFQSGRKSVNDFSLQLGRGGCSKRTANVFRRVEFWSFQSWVYILMSQIRLMLFNNSGVPHP